MARYANGRVPKNKLVYDRHGNPWFPGTYNKWVRFQKRVHDLRGKWLYITPKAHGAYNTYRDYDGQVSIRAALGINAAVPGTSSHGGVWTGQTTRWGWVSDVEAGAFDVSGWDEDDWPAMVKAADEVGLHADIVVPRERWHFVDLEPWASGSPANVDTQPIELPEDELSAEAEKKIDRILDIAYHMAYGKAGHWPDGDGGRVLRVLRDRSKDADEILKRLDETVEQLKDLRPGRAGQYHDGEGFKVIRDARNAAQRAEAKADASSAAVEALSKIIAQQNGVPAKDILARVEKATREGVDAALKNLELTLSVDGDSTR